METQIIHLLVQMPILAVFIWWMNKQNNRWDQNNSQWRQYLAERNNKTDKALEKLVGAIDRFHEKLDK